MCVPVNLDILLRPLGIQQSGFVKGAHRLEPCWLVIAKYVRPGDQKVFGGQGKRRVKLDGLREQWKTGERTWHSFGICVCFSLEIG